MNEENSVKETTKKKNSLSIIVILLGLVLIGTGLFLFFGTDIFKSDKKKDNKKVQTETSVADKFVGIYKAENDKMFIHKTKANEFYYVIGDSFEGTAIVDGETAKEVELFNEGRYFEFKLVDGGIEITYHADEDVLISVDTGKYTKVAEYTKENVYKEAVGDPSLLNSKYSGLFKSGNIELYLYQMDDKKVQVSTHSDEYRFQETFEIESDNKLVAKSFFDENETAFEIVFNDKEFTLTANENVFGFDEDDKEFELTYSFEKALTENDIISNFYDRY